MQVKHNKIYYFRPTFYNHTVTTREYIIWWGFLVTDDCLKKVQLRKF